MNRREWIRFAPAAALVLAEQDAPAQAPLTNESLRTALKLLGLDASDTQLEMMRPNVERALTAYTSMRAHSVPLDTDPAFTFHAQLPGMKPPRGGQFLGSAAPAAKRFAKIEDVAYWPLTDLAALVRTRRVTSTALTKMYLERLRRHGETLHCVVTLTEELALQQAARADKEIAAGRYKGPLHGIPYGAKDLFATKNNKTTWGAEPFQEQLLDYNATIIDKLETAGAVLVAKLSMGALALGGQWFGGMTRNPWNTEKTSSGSSAGSASATAAGLVGFSIGTETLGSILSPSRVCGVTGLRPTFGRVSRHGAMSLCWTMDKIGPICRSVADCMLVLRAIEGPDGKDGSVHKAPLAWNPASPLSAMKIGYIEADFAKQNGERKKLFDSALETLRKRGAKLKPATLPEFPVAALRVVLNAESAAAFDDLTRDGGVEKLSGQRPSDWPNSFRSARLIPAVEYLRAMRIRTQLMRAMDEFFAAWDVIVSPAFSDLLTITNMTGHPQIGVPCGFVKKEPEAVHFTGRIFEEGPMSRVAKAYQDATDWTNRRPDGF
ncbi:MAG: amidase [Acidobacteria bacterium]|nr:amidase [Acidobacteriota bacterium]